MVPAFLVCGRLHRFCGAPRSLRLKFFSGCYFIVALAAEGLVNVLFSEHYELVALGEPVRVVCEVAAADADGVHFLDVLGYCHQGRHRAERLALEIGVQAGYDDPLALVGKGLDHFHQVFPEELCLVNAYHLGLIRSGQHVLRILCRPARYAVEVVGNHVHIGVSRIHGRLEDLYFLIGELGSLESPDEFFGLAGKH